MVEVEKKTDVIDGIAPDAVPYDELMAANKPAILKGLASDWPLVQKAQDPTRNVMDYILSFYEGRPVTGSVGPPEIKGRLFYNDDATDLNFSASRVRLDEFLAQIETSLGDDQGPSYYIGSTDVDAYLPGFRHENDLVLNNAMFENTRPLVGIWIGNRTTATAHYDMSNNMACCMVGHRRFTLFPPDQVHNLYPGPLEPTPGGQVVSMVDFREPDFDTYPRFREALSKAEVADLEPGDVLIYPAMWWHHVEALDDFNILVNYWWNTVPAYMDTPQNTLLHAFLSLRDRPQAEKDAWRSLFDYYIFGAADEAGRHLPEQARGVLGPMDDMKARRLRSDLLRRLNR